MPIRWDAPPTLRLALGLAIAALIGWGRGGQFAYILPMLALMLLAPGGRPPAVKQVIALLAITGLSCLWGLLIAPLLTYAAPAGVLLILLGIATSAYFASRYPALAIPLKLFIIGNTLITVVAFQSQSMAQSVAYQLLVDISLAVGIVWIVSVLIPDRSNQPEQKPLPGPSPIDASIASWIAIRSALVMALPLVLALHNPSLFMMTLINGAQLAQQPDSTDVKQNGLAIVTSTAAGGAMALVFWTVLGWWPELVLLVGGLAIIALFVGPYLHGPDASIAARLWWPPALSAMILVLGSTVADSANGTDIWVLTLRRIFVMLLLAAVAAFMVWGFDQWRNRREMRRASRVMGKYDAIQ